ncbi:SUMF1/EgtB/PvdO family nonheme iron enzyme [Nostoc sp. XA013]|nr:formylglycine-generating enzyme family protein [Nostoc sp. XA013]
MQCPKCSVPVGSFPANAFGLYNMHGNISDGIKITDMTITTAHPVMVALD